MRNYSMGQTRDILPHGGNQPKHSSSLIYWSISFSYLSLIPPTSPIANINSEHQILLRDRLTNRQTDWQADRKRIRQAVTLTDRQIKRIIYEGRAEHGMSSIRDIIESWHLSQVISTSFNLFGKFLIQSSPTKILK